MADWTFFDSILDAAFVVDGSGKISYCNDPGASFCQSSVRRLVGKALLSDHIQIEEPGILPFTETSPGRREATPFIETVYHHPKSGKSGKVQLAIRPLSADSWGFFIRDVSLEEALHSKYRSELAQKEDYARNLEKLVEARTAELRMVNQTLNAILDSLGQGFFTFNADGDCGDVYTKACETILESVPKGKKVWETLGVPDAEREQFGKWLESMFKEYLPFEDLRGLGPSLFPHSQSRHVVLEYYPIRREQDAVADIVVVATDKTAEYQAQQALEHERQFASMIVKFTKNKDQFLSFLNSVRETLKILKASQDADERFRLLHTLEGEAGTFSINRLRLDARSCQHALSSGSPLEYERSLEGLIAGYESFLAENKELFRLPQGKVSRVVEISADRAFEYYSQIRSLNGSQQIAEAFRDTFLKTAVEERFLYFDGLVQSVAEKLGKRIKPLVVNGNGVRIFPEPYQKVFSAFVHAFRNAVDHGLEDPTEREWAGKESAGQITVTVARVDRYLKITISDDGKGIDPAAIREKLASRFPDKDFSKLSDQDLIQQVSLPGFSSRETVGEFSGRGVGLDALREEVLKIGGQFHINSKVGSGTDIEILLPELELEPQLLRSA